MTTDAPLNGIHATLIVQSQRGVLLVGPSSSGKSRYALQRLKDGDKLVSDDLVLLSIHKGNLIGSSPEKNQGWLHLHTRGFINVKQCFGEQALLPSALIEQVYSFDPTYLSKFYHLNQVQLPCDNKAHFFA